MAREVKKLKAIQISSLPPGTHSDGGNLLLRVRESGSRSWVFRYKQNGRAIELGLGSTSDRTLAEARDTANDCSVQLRVNKALKKYYGQKGLARLSLNMRVNVLSKKRLAGEIVSMQVNGKIHLSNTLFHS